MIVSLPKSQFSLVRPLIAQEQFHVASLGVITGEMEGHIWVDNVSHPKTALIADNIWVIHLFGNPHNHQFNRDAGNLIRTHIFPSRQKDPEIDPGWVLTYDSAAWMPKIRTEFQLAKWQALELRHYTINSLALDDWESKIPENYSIGRVDAEFLESLPLENHEGITTWIRDRFFSPADFLKRGFCFYLYNNDSNEIVSWALSEWTAENYVLMGLVTEPAYQKQGFASLVVAAASEYGLAHHRDLRWFCATINEGSWKTAEKVGYQQVWTESILVGEYPSSSDGKKKN